ncbi:Lrp/AsnC family transcriptional regulator [Streptomyces sp. G45]|uniref:Lrp/AsnC family transcriptional regulator n=1 Tax=Streptomyces sp. G45 TaxID=3406627 RepID=UPI003C22873E
MKLVHALEVDARAPFSRLAAVLGVSDQTVARRYRKLRAEARLRVVAVREREDEWLLRLRCTPDSAQAIATALAKRPDTAWIHITSAGTEVVCMSLPRDPGDYDDLMFGKLLRTPHIVEIRAHQLLHRFYGGRTGWIGKHGPLTPGQVAALTPARPHGPRPPGPARITPEDEPLIAALKPDGRATYPELGRATGRSESAVKRRLAQLLDSGALYLDTEYDTEYFGFGTAAMLWITVAPRLLRAVGEAMAEHPEIAHASATTGPSNLMASAHTRDTKELYTYLSDRLGTLDGVQHVEAAPLLRRYKQLTYQYPPH